LNSNQVEIREEERKRGKGTSDEAADSNRDGRIGEMAQSSAPESRIAFSPFSALLRGGFGRLQEFIESEQMTFVVNGESFVVPLPDALLLSSKVSESVRNDLNSRSFEIWTDCAKASDFGDFLSFVHLSSVETLDPTRGLSFLLFCNLVGNDNLSLLLLSLLHPIDFAIDISHLIRSLSISSN
jgi:hypothetical protein